MEGQGGQVLDEHQPVVRTRDRVHRDPECGQELPAGAGLELRDGGGIAAVRPFAGETERGITIHMVWVREYMLEQEKLDALRRQVEDGVVTLRVAATYPPEQASDAQALLEQGGTRGRLVIQFRPEP